MTVDLCGFRPPAEPLEGRVAHFGLMDTMLGAFESGNLNAPINEFSEVEMFRPTPKNRIWRVTKWDGAIRAEVRHTVANACDVWPATFWREAKPGEAATLEIEVTNGAVCGSSQAIGCMSWSSGTDLVQVRAGWWQRGPTYALETLIHELGHVEGLLDGYISRACGDKTIGGANYYGAMGFAEGPSGDKLGGHPSQREKIFTVRSKRSGRVFRC